MLRETTFAIGGWITIELGILLAAGLAFSGAGVEFVDAWLASGIAVGFGTFFLYVAHDEHRDRLEFLENAEKGPPELPGQGPK